MEVEKKRDINILIILILVLIIINYSSLDNALENFLIDYELVNVERIIDGDTLIADGKSTRLLGINSPERGELYYLEAKQFLEEMALNRTGRLEFGRERTDRYNRTLAYIFINGQNINIMLVKKGLANFYFPSGKGQHYNEFEQAWQQCIENNINLCEKSEVVCSSCIKLKEFNYKNQKVVFHNQCDFSCDLTGWEIKDEGRKKFVFPKLILMKNEGVEIKVGEEQDNEDILYWGGETYVWTGTGDTLFLRDADGKLVLWESY